MSEPKLPGESELIQWYNTRTGEDFRKQFPGELADKVLEAMWVTFQLYRAMARTTPTPVPERSTFVDTNAETDHVYVFKEGSWQESVAAGVVGNAESIRKDHSTGEVWVRSGDEWKLRICHAPAEDDTTCKGWCGKQSCLTSFTRVDLPITPGTGG